MKEWVLLQQILLTQTHQRRRVQIKRWSSNHYLWRSCEMWERTLAIVKKNPLTTWWLRCRDTGSDTINLDGKEAQQLGFLARDRGIDKALVDKTKGLRLWRWLLSAVRTRYLFEDDIECHLVKWRTMDEGIKNLRELAVWQLYCEVSKYRPWCHAMSVTYVVEAGAECTFNVCPHIVNSDLGKKWPHNSQLWVKMAQKAWQYDDNLSGPLQASVSALEEIARKTKKSVAKVFGELVRRKKKTLFFSQVNLHSSH